MKKHLVLLFFIVASLLYGQNNNQNHNWRFGGGIGLGFGGGDYFGLNISPFLGYMLSPGLEGGVTAGYQYSKWNQTKLNLFSGGPYMNFYPIPNLFLRAHYEYFTGNVQNDKKLDFDTKSSFDEDALWLGAGYRTPGRISFRTGLLYNVLYKEGESHFFSSGFRPYAGVSIGF